MSVLTIRDIESGTVWITRDLFGKDLGWNTRMIPAKDNTMQTAFNRMLQMIAGYWKTQIARAAAHYSLADELAKGPASAAEIAARQSTDPDATLRLLRACARVGLVVVDADGRFASTELLDTLRRDAPGSLRNQVLTSGGPGYWLPWGKLIDAVRTGERQTMPTLGQELWEHYAAQPDEAAAFTNVMSEMSAMAAPAVAGLIDTQTTRVAADIGGSAGVLLHALMEANPALEGVLLERPDIIPAAVAAAKRLGLEERFSAIAGDFRVSVPKADLYLLKHIVHGWDDASCIRILENCARAMNPGGRVVVIEYPLDEPNAPGFLPFMDLSLLLMTSGRERTVAQYRELLAAAGLSLAKVTPTGASVAVMEAVAKG